MAREDMEIYRLTGDRLNIFKSAVVEEFALKFIVNGHELLTLTASPHQLNYLATGFLYLQGFISHLDDLLTMGLCEESGIASIRINKPVPERLLPILTSGCGRGISFTLPAPVSANSKWEKDTGIRFTLEGVQRLMKGLGKKAERYKAHGGIHSAAVGDNEGLWLYTEDLGRHNTVDRVAGEALMKGIDLQGAMFVTSGRVSTEIAAKCVRLGIALIASRTSPTNMAVRMCDEAGITLIGYVRGGSLEIYTHPEQIQLEHYRNIAFRE